jgi:transposase
MGPKPKHTDTEFCHAWDLCETMEQLARRLGVNVASVKTRARKLRAQGVDLPRQRVCP